MGSRDDARCVRIWVVAIAAVALVMAASSGTALAASSFGYLGQFAEPMDSGGINFLGAAVDPSTSDVYFTTGKYEQVFNFDPSGTLVNQYGGFAGTAGDGKFAVTDGVAVDPNTSDVYVTDDDNDRVEKFDSSGNFISQFGSTGEDAGDFEEPSGVAVNPTTGDVYVVDRANSRVDEFDSSGAFIEAWGWSVQYGIADFGICTDDFCLTGNAGPGAGQFNGPDGVAIDPSSGEVYVADTGNNRVEEFDSDGTYIGQFGTTGSGDGQFSAPEGVAVDPNTNDVYVADTGNDRVEEFDSDGTYIGQFGSSGSGDAQFNNPEGVAVDPSTSDVYVVDAFNNRVEKFGETGPLTLSNVPSNITTGATSTSGAPVTYTPPTAGGGDASTPSVSCSPASGSLFPIGTTTVTCTANDSSGLVTPVSASFTVTVTRLAAHLAVAPAKHGLIQLTFSARLTGVLGGAPLAGQTVDFSEQNHPFCHATTSSQGIASCTIYGFAVGPATYTATYTGDNYYQGTTGTGAL